MNSHDETNKILKALSNDAGDDSLMEMALATFRGRRRGWTVFVWALSFLWFAGAIYCAIRFFDGTTVQSQIAWATGFLFSMMAVTALKIWAWMDMIHGSTMRELKRVEAAMVRLAEAVGER